MLSTDSIAPPAERLRPAGSSFASADSSVLDFLRAIAVALVLGSHFMEGTRIESLWWVAQRVGWMGVMLFFVHTSLVLMFSLDRTPAHGTRLLNYFYVRRAFRIYPLSIVTVFVVLALGIPVASWPWQPADTSGATVLANLLLVQNLVYAPNVLGPMWSLPLEIQMYLVLPFLFWIVRRGTRLDIGVLLWILAVGLAFVQPHITDRANVAQYAPCFMGGVLAFCLTKRQATLWPFWVWVLALGAMMLMFLVLTANRENAHLMPASWALALTVGCLIPHFRETMSVAIRRVSVTIAKYSYGIYLTHMIAYWVAFNRLGGVSLWIRGLVGLGLTATFSAIAYHFVEAPGMRLGGTLGRRLLGQQTLRTVRSEDAIATSPP